MRSSRGEIKIEEILEKAGLNFIEEYTFPDLISSSGKSLRFDFAVMDDEGNLDFLIEYQGIQHFDTNNPWWTEILEKHDKMKREYCYNNNIKLIEIMYYDDIEKILKDILLR